jgi:hypothetical protein
MGGIDTTSSTDHFAMFNTGLITMGSDSDPTPKAKLPKSGRRVREVPAPSIRFHFENARDFPMITLHFSLVAGEYAADFPMKSSALTRHDRSA